MKRGEAAGEDDGEGRQQGRSIARAHARPLKALVGRAQFGPALLPARKRYTGHQERGKKETQVSATRQVTTCPLREDKKTGADAGADCLACSQSPTMETVVARMRAQRGHIPTLGSEDTRPPIERK